MAAMTAGVLVLRRSASFLVMARTASGPSSLTDFAALFRVAGSSAPSGARSRSSSSALVAPASALAVGVGVGAGAASAAAGVAPTNIASKPRTAVICAAFIFIFAIFAIVARRNARRRRVIR